MLEWPACETRRVRRAGRGNGMNTPKDARLWAALAAGAALFGGGAAWVFLRWVLDLAAAGAS